MELVAVQLPTHAAEAQATPPPFDLALRFRMRDTNAQQGGADRLAASNGRNRAP